MIYFKNIKWKNFLSTGNTFTEIDFTKTKSTLIVGENGAGKSTILDALSFALYGKPFRKINKPQLVNAINQKGLEVHLEFSIGKRNYTIKRGIKPTLFEIYLDDNMINQDAESREYQEMFERNILRLNHKSFSQIVVLGSASFVPFMQLSSMHRREVIEDLLDIQIFSTMNTLLKEKVTENRNSITDTDYNMKSSGEKILILKKHINVLKANTDEIIKQKEEKIEEYNGQIQAANSNIDRITKLLNVANHSISDKDSVRQKIKRLDTLGAQIDQRLSKLEKELSFFQEHNDCPTCRQGIEHSHKQEIIEPDFKPCS